MKNIKRVFKLGLVFSLVVLVCFGFDFIMVSNNLASYSVFYARNVTELEGDDLKDLEVELLLKNLDRMKLPDVEGYEYDFDAINAIYSHPQFTTSQSITMYKGPITEIRYSDALSNAFIFDENFKNVKRARSNGKTGREIIVDFDQVAVKREVYDLVAPVLDNLREPRVNLQWLFNWVYRDQIR